MKRYAKILMSSCLILAGCAMGPRAQLAMPDIRSVPVLASLSAAQSLERGRVFLASKQYGLAIELFKAASRDPALRVEGYNGLAIAYDGIGRADLAQRYFEQALAARPGDRRAQNNLAIFYASSGQRKKELTLLAQVAANRKSAPFALHDDAANAPPETDRGSTAMSASLTNPSAAPSPWLTDKSPLSGAFLPLFANNVLPNVPAGTSKAIGENRTANVAVACPQDKLGKSIVSAESEMKIFRISVGEVLISSRNAEEFCFVEGDAVRSAGFGATTTMSNMEYLGQVAAYLDRLNNLQHMADLSRTWREIFWPTSERSS